MSDVRNREKFFAIFTSYDVVLTSRQRTMVPTARDLYFERTSSEAELHAKTSRGEVNCPIGEQYRTI